MKNKPLKPAAKLSEGWDAYFEAIADLLEGAGLGSANYVYNTLKWRLAKPTGKGLSLSRALRKHVERALAHPPHIPLGLCPSPIVVATSSTAGARLRQNIVKAFPPGEASLCEALPQRKDSFRQRLYDRTRLIFGLIPGLFFATRVHHVLSRAEVDEANHIAGEAFRHAIYCKAARSILNRTRATCLALGKANRPFEQALWAMAKARGISTALIPHHELSLGAGEREAHPFSLCRGEFDVAIPFSNFTAARLQQLKPNLRIMVGGFPNALKRQGVKSALVLQDPSTCRNVLYLTGHGLATNEEMELDRTSILRQALANCSDLRLRVRFHPKMEDEKRKKLFGWLRADQISYPEDTTLSTDLLETALVVHSYSTGVVEAMIAGLPAVWLTPRRWRLNLERDPLHKQGLRILDVSEALQLRELVRRLLGNESEWKRVVEAQWSRLRSLGYDRDYYSIVVSVLRQQAGLKAREAETVLPHRDAPD
jgi:hypothetical protein